MRRVVYVKKTLSKTAIRRLKIGCIFILVFIVLIILFIFVGFPLIFMNSIELQRLFMFTNLNLPSDESYYKMYELKAGLKNYYVSVKDYETNSVISLGVWHLLPHILINASITEDNFGFEHALKYSNISILLYFHGTGEDRSTSLEKYHVLRYFFHVITFDYRSYGDSTKATLSENAVIDDCLQLYQWLTNKTLASIFLWGHSLGSALVTKTAALINNKTTQPVGLILEAPFTKMQDELYFHPYGKIFAWLPWFNATVVAPLAKNGFIFDTSKYIKMIDYPIMILNSEDDSIVPYRFGEELYKIAKKRFPQNRTLYYRFPYNLGYDHNFIYEDQFLPFFINYFVYICLGDE